MLDACFPQPLGCLVIGELEADHTLELIKLARSNFDEKVVPLVRNLQDFRPRKSIDPQPVAVHEQTGRTDAHGDVEAGRVLGRMHFDAVHGQLLRVLQKMQLGLGGCLALVLFVQLGNFLLEFWRLVGREMKVRQVVRVVLFFVVIAQLRLHQVRAEQRVRYERARQSATQDVVANLQTEHISA